MTDYLALARAIEGELIENRRTLHKIAEIGFDLPETVTFVQRKLAEYGYTPMLCGKAGVTCTVGKPGKTILLRADMDALPMPEESGLPYASTNGNCHSCGHDTHTAMLLAAARLLKEHEGELAGTVKFMFQPAEERLGGAKDMIEHGLLENPKVDAALGLHIYAGMPFAKSGVISSRGTLQTKSGDGFLVKISGREVHGSRSYTGVDAINIAAHTIIALQELISREIPSEENSVLIVGKMQGGTSANSVAGTAVLDVCLRCASHEQRRFLTERLTEVCEGVAKTFRGSVEIEHMYGAPPLITDAALTEELLGYVGELIGTENIIRIDAPPGGGEDFAYVAERVPTANFNLGGGNADEGHPYANHQPAITFDEASFAVGAATYASCAARWLENAAK